MEIDLGINKDLTKEAVCEKLERYQSLPMVLQILESKGNANDKLHDEIDYVMEFEFQKIDHEISKRYDKELDPDGYKEAFEDNSRIYKENLKKIMKLMGKISGLNSLSCGSLEAEQSGGHGGVF